MAETVYNYEYKPLDGPGAIRLLKLGSYDEETMIFDSSLQTINLNEYRHPPYYALSYTWQLPNYEGEESPPRPSPVHIRCDNKILEIGENLFDCLYQLEHLPKEDEDQSNDDSIWIDAICINQADLVERSSQVTMMQKIYSEAAGTLIWLGREDRFSRHAIPLVQKLSEAAESHMPSDDNIGYDMLLPGQLRDEEFFSLIGIPPLTLKDWETIGAFFSRSWFHRVWTVQELVMGKEIHKMIICGDKALSLEDITGFIHLALVKGWVNTLRTLEFTRSRDPNAITSLGIEISIGMGAIYKALQQGPMSGLFQHVFHFSDEDSFLVAKFAWMLSMCRQKKATDERDRVFSSSGMISQYRKPGFWHLLGPDYSKPTEAVFTNVSKFIIRSLGNLSWLSLVEDRSLRVHHNLPSWVPDLAVVARPLFLRGTTNSNVFRNHQDTGEWLTPFGNIMTMHNTSLSATGLKLDILAYAVHDLNKAFVEHKKISDIVVAASRFPTYGCGDTWLVALMETLAVGTPTEIDLDTGHAVGASFENFNHLMPSFLHFLKLGIAQEIWRWNPSRSDPRNNWWDAHVEFSLLCDVENSLPSQAEFKDFFSIFNALYPSKQDAKVNPMIEDEEYLQKIHNPQLPYLRRAAVPCAFRTFVQTENARMGLAPLSAKLEDEVWIIKGADVPFILRQRSNGTYELIGEAYIHGIMQGELFERGEHLDFRSVTLQ